jgi:hypothetical protein
MPLIDSLKIKRGNKANLPVLMLGEPGYCIDTGEVFLGGEVGNDLIGRKDLPAEFDAHKAETVNIKYAPYNAVGDGITDDTAAIIAAIASVPAGGTLYIPIGKFKITNTITINKAISIKGEGPASCIWISLTDNTKQAVIIGSPFAIGNSENQRYEDFAVMGGNNSCKNGLAFYNVHRSQIKNVHVSPGSTQQAVIVGGCLMTHFNLICQGNSADGYYPGVYMWNGAAILIQDLRNHPDYVAGSVMPTNACVFDCICEAGTTTGGICQEAQDLAGGNNVFTGTYEGFMNAGASAVKGSGYSIKIEGGIGFTIREAHCEETLNGVAIDGGQCFTVRNSLFAPIPTEKLTITNSKYFDVTNITVGLFTINSGTCSKFKINTVRGAMDMNYVKYQDSNIGKSYPSSDNYAKSGLGEYTAENLIPNGNLSRSPGFSYIGGNPTLTQCGVGLADTMRRFNQKSLKVSGTGTGQVLRILIPDIAQFIGQPITIWADIKYSSGVGISFGAYDNAGYKLANEVPSTEAGWVRVAFTFYPNAAADGSIMFYPVTNNPYAFYLGGFGAVLGESAPCGIESPLPSFSNGVQIAGNKIVFGTAAPAAGSWLVGDICKNSAPAVGQPKGWVCTVAGSPGTWVSEGNL